MKLSFEFEADEEYFKNLLCSRDEKLEIYHSLFDFREPTIKREEFNKIRNKLLDKLTIERGLKCELQFEDICDLNSGLNIDHMIPLSSNILNKKLRKLKSIKGKKIKTQSFGSNDEKNLLLACANCNSHKKHNFLDKEKIKLIIHNRFK